MNVSLRNDYSTLFNSMNSNQRSGAAGGVSSLAGLVSDYNTIKNGSYNKLVKAYYKKMGEDGNTGKAAGKTGDLSETRKKTGKNSTSAEYSRISSEVSSVKDSLKSLSGDGKTSLFEAGTAASAETVGKEGATAGVDRDRINSAVSDFVNGYNDLIKTAGASSSGAVKSRAEMMTSQTLAYFKPLAGIGITLQENGTLSLDKDKLASADTESIKKLFNGTNSYGDKISSYASLIESGAKNAASTNSTYNAQGGSNLDFSSIWSAGV